MCLIYTEVPKKKERAPDGSKNENVFDIEQGVAISIFAKRPGSPAIVRHADIWGSRLEKYSLLAEGCLGNITWTDLNPNSPDYLFLPAREPDDAYREFMSVLEIFPVRSTGVQTSRDQLVIGFTEEDVRTRLDDFANQNIPDDFFRSEFFREHRTGRHLRGDTRGWKLSEARQWATKNRAELIGSISPIAYRPFDTRFVADHPQMIDWPRHEVMQHLRAENVALLPPRQLATQGFRHSFRADLPSEMCVISTKTKEQNYVFPLWLQPEGAREFRTFPPISVPSSTLASSITTHPKKSSATSTRSYMRRPIAHATPSTCAETSRVYPFPRLQTISKHYRDSVGPLCRHTSCDKPPR